MTAAGAHDPGAMSRAQQVVQRHLQRGEAEGEALRERVRGQHALAGQQQLGHFTEAQAQAGVGMTAGRFNAAPKAREKSRLVTGVGAVPL